MNRALAFAASALLTAWTASADGVIYRLDSSDHLPDNGSSVWVQNADGVLHPEDAQGPIRHAAGAAEIRVYSAATGASLGGALAWWIASDTGTPLVTRSNLVADEKGTLHLPLLSGLRLRVWAEGHEVVELDATKVRSIHELALWPGSAAALHVTGAKTPVQIRYFIGTHAAAGELAAVTDSSGRMAWPGTPRSGIRIEIVDPRFAVAGVTLQAGQQRELTLHAAQRVVAHVVDGDGKPIAKARASAFISTGPAPGDVRRLEWTAGDDGVITLTGLPDGERVAEFTAEGFASRSLRISVGPEKDIGDVQLRPGAPFTLIVRGDDGPIERATVSLEDGQKLFSDHSGRVTIAGLDRRQQPQLEIAATDYVPATMYVRSDMKSPYEVRLRRGSGFRFRLLDALTGDPIDDARVRVRISNRWSDRDLQGHDGEYFAAGFGAGRMQLRIAAPGYLPMTTSAESSDGSADLGALFLSRGAVVRGALIDVLTGKPISGARVETVPPSPMGTMAARLFGDAIDATTDAEGRFTLSGLDPGVVCASVSHPNVGEIPLPLGRVDEDSIHDLGALSIGESGSLAGTVRDSHGSPIADASVQLRFGPVYSPCMTLSGAADEEGKYHFDRVAPGRYHLLALHGHEVLGSRGVVVRAGPQGHEDLEIRMVMVHGSVVVHDLPGSGGMAMLKRAGSDDFTPPMLSFKYIGPGIDPRQRPVTDIVGKSSFSVGPDGTFEGKARLDPGDYEVNWTPADGSAWYYGRVSLATDETALNVRLQLDGIALSGRASAPDGSPVSGAVIRLMDASGRAQRMVIAAADGGFAIPQVPPGRWFVEGIGKGLSGRQTVDVESNPPDPLKLVLAPKEPSRLVVHLDADEDAISIDSVVVTNAAGIVRMARTSPDATFEELPPGEYKLYGIDRRGGIVAGQVLTMGPATTTATFSSRPTRNVRVRCESAEPGQRVALLDNGHSLVSLLAYEGLTPSVLDDGTIPVPPLSDGTWTLQIGDRTEHIEVTRDETFDLE